MSRLRARELRQAFGQFATGVTVVTTLGPSRRPIGVTANSFSSVSLNPPMVLWSLADTAESLSAFETAEHFCVHVLTSAQREVSEKFALRGEDKFGSVSWSWSDRSLPVLDDYVALFECKTTNQYLVGDHVVFVGEVLTYDITDKRPLVFHGGQYAMAERRMMQEVAREFGTSAKNRKDRRKKPD